MGDAMKLRAQGLPAPVGSFLRCHGHQLALALLIGLALFLRLFGINWDQGGLYHPDERAILSRVEEISFPTHDLSSLFDESSSLNPCGEFRSGACVDRGWFPYGSLPLYMLKLTSFLAPPWLEEPSLHQLAIMGRATSAIFDVATILLVYLVATRLFGRWTGLLAASFITLSVLHIQQSHFFVTDIMLATLLMAAFYLLTKVMENGGAKGFALAGLLFGLALATKVSAAPFALAFVAAAALYALGGGSDDPARGERVRRAVGGLAVAAGVGVLAFAIAQPYALIDWRTFWGDVGEQSEMVRRIRDYPFTRQYIGTTAYLYHIRQLAVWGMGLPLGALMWAGLAFSIGAATLRRQRKHLLLLSWVLPYLLITGSFDVKFMRYMLPITPFLAIMGASMVAWSVAWVRNRRPRVLRPQLLYGALALALGFGLFYSLAYLRVYTQPHPAEAASAWINGNVPPGSSLLMDSYWEEGLRDLGRFNHTRMEVYDEESPAKRTEMIERLAGADYLLFYSNRQYGTISRLPERYPMTQEYYELLFDGRLGYELVHWETSYPSLLGVSFQDDTFRRAGLPTPEPLTGYRQTSVALNMGFADESFTVYDHPLVLVFKNSLSGLSEERVAYLDAALPEPGLPLAVQAPQGEKALLSPREARLQQEGGTWSELFNRGSFVNKAPWLFWLLVVQLAFLVTLPITLVLFRWLPDRGYLLGKMLSILLLAYIPWLLASLHWLPFGRASIAFGMGLIALLSLGILRLQGREILQFLRENKGLVVLGELIFLVAFLGFYGIRLWIPDLWVQDLAIDIRGGEKPMDFAYFNAVVRSTYMPPYDPWFAGGSLNYYYFGQFMAATLTKLTGIIPAIAINLAVPLFFAMTVAGAFSIVYNLAALGRRHLGAAARLWPSPILAGLLAVLFVAVIGNMDGIVQLFQGVGRMFSGEPFGAFSFWSSSRLMPPGIEITEFPFFTFLFADPHAHLFVIPLTLLAVGLAMAFVLSARTRFAIVGPMAPLPFLGLGLTLGAIQATNSWDGPTYLLLAGAAVLIAEYTGRRRIDLSLALSTAVKGGLLYGLGYLLFLPFQLRYDTFFDSPFDTVKGSEGVTVLYQYLEIHGLFIFILLSFLAYEGWGRYRRSFSGGPGPTALGFHLEARLQMAAQALGWRWAGYIGAAAVAIGLLAATGYATVAFLAGLLLLMAPLVRGEVLASDQGTPVRLFTFALMVLPLALGIGVDVFNINLPLARMNTVFKLYLQAWVLFGLASAYALWRLRFGQVFAPAALRRGWQALLVLLVACVMIYPLMATPVRARGRYNPLPPSANGMTYMDTAVYRDRGTTMELRWDREAIEWLQDNVQGSPVIVEGLTPVYRWGNRVSVYTGLPAVIGWDWHQRQQRWGYQGVVEQRRREVDSFFRALDPSEAMTFLERYGVTYIYVGELERAYYPQQGLAKFDAMLGRGLELAHENPKVRVYRVLSPH